MLGYLAPLERVRVSGCFPRAPPPLLAAWRASPTDVFLVVTIDSEFRLEKPDRPVEDVSLSLGAVKEPVLFLGIAKMSSLDNFFPSAETLAGAVIWSEFWEARSVSVPSLSEASPRRARRSMDARVGRGAERLLERVRTC